MKVWKTLALCVLGTLIAIPGAAAAGEVMKDGVLWVENEAVPSGGVRNVQLEEMWRVGGEDSEDFFGIIADALFDDAGNLYLADLQLNEIAVYDPDGERVTTLSREGEGPGEIRLPSKILWMPNGALGIATIFPGRVVMIDTEDTPLGNWEIGGDITEGGFMQFFDVFNQGENLVVMAESIEQNPPAGQVRTRFAASYDMEGTELARFEEHRRELDFTNFHWVEDEIEQIEFRHTAVGPDNRVYIASERNEYRINVYQQDGTLARVVTRPYEHQPRVQAEVERIESNLERQLAQLPSAKWTVSKIEPDISALRIGPDGNLWVETSRGGVDQPEGVFYTWDVFDGDGDFLEQVAAHCDGDGLEDMMLWRGDTAVQITGFMPAIRAMQGGGAAVEGDEEAEPMEIICYKVVGD
ncbi:MAG: hypothetical protein GY838_10980 [bacterium]|nr:hypothetical protein [bacterium]